MAMASLKARAIDIMGPATGDQACGENGPGRMLEAEEIVDLVGKSFQSTILSGSRLLITAGPTREAIDPVRYISNRSSGKMGYAIAAAAIEAGADVSLVSGPVNLSELERINLTRVNSAAEMHQAVMQRITDSDIFVSAAAVADYGVASISDQKIKKTSDSFELKLSKNPDILSDVASMQNSPFTVGFAAETENLEENAQKKLESKNVDMIAANQVGEDKGFDVDTNALTVFWKTGKKEFQQAPKTRLARNLIQLIADQYNEKNTNKTH